MTLSVTIAAEPDSTASRAVRRSCRIRPQPDCWRAGSSPLSPPEVTDPTLGRADPRLPGVFLQQYSRLPLARRVLGYAHMLQRRPCSRWLFPLVFFLLAIPGSSSAAAAQAPPGTIQGVVVETSGGPPVENVAVRLQGTGRTVATDNTGRFEFADVPAGEHELYVSVVDFILIKRTLTVNPNALTTVTILLAEGTGAFAQAVTVTGGDSRRRDPEVPAEQTLASRELQQLRGLVTNDPFRAIQVLPGVASGDDLRSDFTVRGSAIDHMGFTFEGVSTPLLVHTVQRVLDTGSLAMINGDVLEEASLRNGAYPQRHGNRLGAEVDFRMREGARDRLQSRLSVSGTDAAAVMEGPLGREQQGSWLLSLRKSYLDLVIARLDPQTDFAFGFVDAQGKLVYDLTAAHQFQLAFTAGRSRFNQEVDETFASDEVKDGRNRSTLTIASWRYLPSERFTVTQRLAFATNDYRNVNSAAFELARGSAKDALYRADWSYAPTSAASVEGGGELRWLSEARHDEGLAFFGPRRFAVRENFDHDAGSASAYGQLRLAVHGMSLVPGLRVEHRTLTGTTAISPWVQASRPLTGAITVRGGAGIYRQEPSFGQVVGLRGDRGLRPERAYHWDAGLEGRLPGRWVWQATFYDREERDVVRLPDAEIRVVGNAVQLPSLTSRFANALSGHARGVELLIQRRSANRFSGWASYALGFSRYRDRDTRETFWGDYDQRHTINLYGLYRLSDRFSVSSRFRSGSNFPAPGYWESREGNDFVSDVRNDLRVRPYARLDVRANRTFAKQRLRLTLYAEALNVLGRENVRYAGAGVDLRTRRAFGLFDSLFPLVPSAGLLLEF
jgi:hypothetical protein